MLKERNIPALKSRKEMLDILFEEEYGNLPPLPEKTEWEVKEKVYLVWSLNNVTLELSYRWSDMLILLMYPMLPPYYYTKSIMTETLFKWRTFCV